MGRRSKPKSEDEDEKKTEIKWADKVDGQREEARVLKAARAG
jgi:hypothetical protein